MGGYFGPDIIIATSVVNGHYGNNDFGRLQSIDPIHAPAQKIFRFPLHNHLAPSTTTAEQSRVWPDTTPCHSQVIKIQMLIAHPLWTLLLHNRINDRYYRCLPCYQNKRQFSVRYTYSYFSSWNFWSFFGSLNIFVDLWILFGGS